MIFKDYEYPIHAKDLFRYIQKRRHFSQRVQILSSDIINFLRLHQKIS